MPHPSEATVGELGQHRAPALQTLTRAEPAAEMLAMSVERHADHPEHRRRAHLPIAPHLFVMRIDDEHRIRCGRERTPAPRGELRVQLLHHRAHLGGRDLRAAELLDDVRDFPRGDALDVNLGQGQDQRLLTPFIAGEETGLKPAGAIPRHPERQRPHAREPGALAIAIAPAAPTRRTFVRAGADELRELALQDIVNEGREHVAKGIIGGRCLLPHDGETTLSIESHWASPGECGREPAVVLPDPQEMFSGFHTSSTRGARATVDSTPISAHSRWMCRYDLRSLYYFPLRMTQL
jgi:hypothetical protein